MLKSRLWFLALFSIIGIFLSCGNTESGAGSSVVATPSAKPAAGAVSSGTTVTLSCDTTGSTIYYYTTDKSSGTDTKYTTPIAITAAETIHAYATKTGMSQSAMLKAAYTLGQAGTISAFKAIDNFDAGYEGNAYYKINPDCPDSSAVSLALQEATDSKVTVADGSGTTIAVTGWTCDTTAPFTAYNAYAAGIYKFVATLNDTDMASKGYSNPNKVEASVYVVVKTLTKDAPGFNPSIEDLSDITIPDAANHPTVYSVTVPQGLGTVTSHTWTLTYGTATPLTLTNSDTLTGGPDQTPSSDTKLSIDAGHLSSNMILSVQVKTSNEHTYSQYKLIG
jgi:hypothetical protein